MLEVASNYFPISLVNAFSKKNCRQVYDSNYQIKVSSNSNGHKIPWNRVTYVTNILFGSSIQRIAIIHYSGTGNKLQQLVNFSFNCNVMPGLSSENSRLLRVFEYVINYRSLLQFFPIFSQFGFGEPTTTSCRRRCRFSPLLMLGYVEFVNFKRKIVCWKN